jgi:hypothetical protein
VECEQCTNHGLLSKDTLASGAPENHTEDAVLQILEQDEADCNPEEWQSQQEADPVIGELIRFKKEGIKPESGAIMRHGPEFASLYQQWNLLEVMDGILYRNIEIAGQ